MIEGYKETKIGILPNDWNVVKQSEVATFYNGRAYKLTEWEKEGVPVIRLQNLTGTGKDYYYSTLKLPEHQYCYKDDLLYMWSATFGPVWWFGEKAIFHYHIWKIEHDVQLLDRQFHYYLLDDVTIRMKNESHGSTMLHVTKGGMEKLLIQLPPLPEQQKIAEILSTVDEKIEVIDQQIIETQELKKGLMQRLLTKGIGHTEFKESLLGMIPKSWEVTNIGSVCKLKGGFAFKSNDACNEGIRWLKIANVGINKIKWDDESFLPFGFDKLYQDYILKEGDIVIAMTRPILNNKLKIARVTHLDKDSLLNQRVGRIEENKKIDKNYAYQFFNSHLFINAMEKEIIGTDPPNISSTMFETLYITLPSIEEQNKIADILNSVDEKNKILLEKKAHYQELKQGLMQQLLTGKIRVKV